MSFIIREPLALKFRPKTLADLVGQRKIVTQVEGMLATKNVPNAILITGISGGGKTTTARIVARYLNCETFDNCGTCKSCVAMDKAQHRDYSEVNAADTRGIDDVRNLIQQAKFRPTMGNLRIICIDEAQQLTPQASQVILKSLEEPSSHTLWILCSMEPEKLHSAIVNRCRHWRIEPVGKEDMVARFKAILKMEKIKGIGDEVLEMLSEFSDGQMRLGLQNLDGAVQFVRANPKITVDDLSEGLRREFETTDDALMVKILSALWQGSAKKAMHATVSVDDAFRMSNKLVDAQTYIISRMLCVEHKNIWTTPYLRELMKAVEAKHGTFNKPSVSMALLANDVLAVLNKMRAEIGTFTVSARPTMVQHILDATDIVREATK